MDLVYSGTPWSGHEVSGTASPFESSEPPWPVSYAKFDTFYKIFQCESYFQILIPISNLILS